MFARRRAITQLLNQIHAAVATVTDLNLGPDWGYHLEHRDEGTPAVARGRQMFLDRDLVHRIVDEVTTDPRAPLSGDAAYGLMVIVHEMFHVAMAQAVDDRWSLLEALKEVRAFDEALTQRATELTLAEITTAVGITLGPVHAGATDLGTDYTGHVAALSGVLRGIARAEGGSERDIVMDLVRTGGGFEAMASVGAGLHRLRGTNTEGMRYIDAVSPLFPVFRRTLSDLSSLLAELERDEHPASFAGQHGLLDLRDRGSQHADHALAGIDGTGRTLV